MSMSPTNSLKNSTVTRSGFSASDRKATFREDATRIGNFHQPRHLMLNLTALDRIIKRKGRTSGGFYIKYS